MGFNITLVNGGGGVFLFHHQVSLGKSFFKVSGGVAHVRGDIAGSVGSLTHVIGPQVFMEQRSARFHGLAYIND